MSTKKKAIRARMEKHKDWILLLIPLVVATLIVVWNLVPADLLGFFSDAYTIALLFTLVLVTILAVRKRR